MPTPSQASQIGEVLVELRLLSARVAENSTDTREARDGMRALKITFEEQNLSAQLIQLRADGAIVVEQLRNDFALANKLVRERIDERTKPLEETIKEHGARLGALEDTHQRVSGSVGVVGWIANRLPWVVTVFASIAAGFAWLKSHH